MTVPKLACILVVSFISLLILYNVPVLLFNQTTEEIPYGKSVPVLDRSISKSKVYNKRAKHLATECARYYSESSSTFERSSSDIETHLEKNAQRFFTIRSPSLMYCATAKVGTRTMFTTLFYKHLQEIYNHITGRQIITDWINIPKKKIINFPSLIKTLRKGGINIFETNRRYSPTEVLRTYLKLFRKAGSKGENLPKEFILQKLTLPTRVPYLSTKSLANLSNIFSQSHIRLMFARHPFERLGSAYSDKMVKLANTPREKEEVFDRIRYRLCDRYKMSRKSHEYSSNINSCQHYIPSFEQFVDFVLRGQDRINQMDVHWRPYSSICNVCEFQYNFIGKMETMDADLKTILELLDLSFWNSKMRRNASNGTSEYYRELFMKLSDETICRLFRLYAQDFRFFEYSLEDYVNRPGLDCSRILS